MKFEDYKQTESKIKEYIILMLEINDELLTVPTDEQVKFLEDILKHKEASLSQKIEKEEDADKKELLEKQLQEIKSMRSIFAFSPNTVPNFIKVGIEEFTNRKNDIKEVDASEKLEKDGKKISYLVKKMQESSKKDKSMVEETKKRIKEDEISYKNSTKLAIELEKTGNAAEVLEKTGQIRGNISSKDDEPTL